MLEKRLETLRAALPEDCEAALIQTEVSRFWLLDFDSDDAGTLVVLPHRMVFIVDSRYIESAREKVKNADVVLESDALTQVLALLHSEGVHRLFIEDGISLARWRQVREKLTGIELEAGPTLSKALATLRAVKDAEEVTRMERAQAVTDACFAHILPFVKEGVREVDLMLEMEHYMRAHGAQKVAFDTICVAGANTSQPHGVPSENRIKPGDFITFDFGARVDGYCADMTRTVALGQPGEEQRKIYDLVLEAHLAGLAAARPGRPANEVDAAARDLIAAAGYGEWFGHGLGHAVGIEIHEEPRFSPKCTIETKAGMMMTVEPGVYLPGRFGCRIEDCVLLTPGGCHPLPTSPKELLVL